MRILYTSVASIVILLLSFSCDTQNSINNSLLYPVFVNGKWGAINCTGDIIIDFSYDWIYFNRDGSDLILAELDSIKMVIDQSENIIIDSIEYENIVIIRNNDVFIEQMATNDTIKISFNDKSLELYTNKDCKGGKNKSPWNQELSISNEYVNQVSVRNSDLKFVVGQDFYGYLDALGTPIWIHKVDSLKLLWEEYSVFMKKKKTLKDKRDDMYVLYREKLVFLMRDLQSQENIDFNFDKYQVPLII